MVLNAATGTGPTTTATISPLHHGWIMRPADELSEDDQAALKDARARFRDIAAITDLHGFIDLVRGRHGDQLTGWIADSASSAYPEIRGFANGLGKDLEAVTAGPHPAVEFRCRRRPDQSRQDA